MNKIQPYFFFILLAATLILSFFIFRPFLQTLVLAAVAAIIATPLYRKFASKTPSYPGFAAFLTILVIIIFALVPLTFLGVQIFNEAVNLYGSLASGDSLSSSFHSAISRIQETLGTNIDVGMYLRQGLVSVIENLNTIFSSIAKLLIGLFVFVISLYYFLKEGTAMRRSLIAISPLSDTEDETIIKKLSQAVNSVVKGNLTIALIQGILTGIGFAIFGIENPVLWGTVAAFAALIPGVGTSLILAPAIVFTFIAGDTFSAVGLLIWGVVAVGLVDNFLGPRLIGRGTRMHPLAVLLAVLGGIALFGPVGFLIGPLTLSFLYALLDIYSSSRKTAQV